MDPISGWQTEAMTPLPKSEFRMGPSYVPNQFSIGVRTVAVGSGPAGVAFDGSNIWVANRGDDTVTEIRVSDGTVIRTKSIFDRSSNRRRRERSGRRSL